MNAVASTYNPLLPAVNTLNEDVEALSLSTRSTFCLCSLQGACVTEMSALTDSMLHGAGRHRGHNKVPRRIILQWKKVTGVSNVLREVETRASMRSNQDYVNSFLELFRRFQPLLQSIFRSRTLRVTTIHLLGLRMHTVCNSETIRRIECLLE